MIAYPYDWHTFWLKNIAKNINDKNTNNEVKNVFTNSAIEGIIIQSEFFDKKIAGVKTTDKYTLVRKNDFVYNPRVSLSAPYGPINMNETNLVGIVSPLYTVFRFFSDLVNKDYMKYYFKSTLWHRYLYNISNEGARHDRMSISLTDFYNMPIQLPNLPEQKKIAEILSTWDEAIELKIKEKDILSDILQRNINSLTKTNSLIKEKYHDIPFHKIALFVNGFPFDSSTYLEKGKYTIITIGNVQDGSFDFSSSKKSIDSLPQGLDDEQVLKQGDILLSMTGNVGRVCKVDQDNCLLNQRVGKIVPQNGVDKLYLYYAIRSQKFLRKMISKSQGGAQLNLSTKDIKNYRFSVPNEDTQKLVSEFLRLLEEKTKLVNREIDLLKLQKQGLMQRLLTGKVRVKLD